MKVTVAKYYIPSGRCIQAIDYSYKDDDGHFTKIPDSLITAFETRNGRVVYDGGGIEPDVVMDPIRFSNLAFNLVSRNLVFDYCTDFYWEHPDIAAAEQFEISDEIYNDFTGFLSENDYTYVSDSEEKLKEMKKTAEEEEMFEEISELYEQLMDQIHEAKQDDLVKYREEISRILRQEIVTRYYYNEGSIISSLSDDPEIGEAIEILNDPDTYYGILDGSIVIRDESVEAPE
jgi:carboxyl-terminal processing protease